MDRIDHYELQELLARGGMSKVYRALDTRLQRVVAVKILDETLKSDPQTAVRFHREARLCAGLRHPNIVTVYDCSSEDKEILYLVTELVAGGSLRDRMADIPWPAEFAALVLLPIARALGAAHRQGIIHRDVKPDNILVDCNEETPSIKLADFGVAVVIGDPRLTTDGSISGSVAYMAPEQLQGKEPTPAADIWSIGVVLYELAHGKMLFDGKSVAQVVAQIIDADSSIAEKIDSEIFSSELKMILSRCLAFDPQKRVANGFELAQAIEQALLTVMVNDVDEHLKQWTTTLNYPDKFRLKLADELVSKAAEVELHKGVDFLERALSLVPDHKGALSLLKAGGRNESKKTKNTSKKLKPSKIRLPLLLFLLLGIAIAAGWAFIHSSNIPRVISSIISSNTGQKASDSKINIVANTKKESIKNNSSFLQEQIEEKSSPVQYEKKIEVEKKHAGQTRPSRSNRTNNTVDAKDANLHLTTDPWAEVFLDGRSLGYTPKVKEIQLPPGSHSIELANPMCTKKTLQIKVSDKEILVRHIKLEVQPALLKVKAPYGWTVYIDDRKVGVAPLSDLNVVHGEHVLRVQDPKGKKHELKVHALAGKTVLVDFMESK